ncbi:thioesterase II family protein, partial [Rathayibacter tritici]
NTSHGNWTSRAFLSVIAVILPIPRWSRKNGAPQSARASDLDDDAFLREVQRFAGYEHPALAMPELREILLPMLRADVQMHEDYLPDDRRPIRAPILTLRGTDDELVDSAQMEQWAEATTGGLRSVEISGPHMYLVEEPRRVVDAIVGKVLTPDVA